MPTTANAKKIYSIKAREILDSRGNPTLEVRAALKNGLWAKASVPSGSSIGRHEAHELRDGEARFNGLGVKKAVHNVNIKIAQALKGQEVTNQQGLDKIMIALDASDNKKRLGANSILGVSLVCAKLGALVSKMPLYKYLWETFNLSTYSKKHLPTPLFNIFNGGKHADTNLDFQEFMIIPVKECSVAEKVQIGSEIFYSLGNILHERGLDMDKGDEGGYAPDISSSVQAIEMIVAAIQKAGYEPGKEVALGIDVGSSVLYNLDKKKYIFKLDHAVYTNSTLVGLYYEWFRKFPIILLEDGLAEDDWRGWQELTKELGSELILVGDDLFTTNTKRLEEGIAKNVANAIIIKPNQIGTLTETIECVELAQEHNYKIVVSHRSGETNDDFIADLAVAIGADFLKAGAPARGERVAKYNRLLEIEEE